jgi:hypothetical protein
MWPMTYKGTEYLIVETADPHVWQWVVRFEDREETGASSSEASAAFVAVKTIDRVRQRQKQRNKWAA